MSERYLYNNVCLVIIYNCRYRIVKLVIRIYYYRFFLNLRRLNDVMKILIKLIHSNLKIKTNIQIFAF